MCRHQIFFDIIYQVLPIISRQRFNAEWMQNPSSLPTLCLVYSIALLGASISTKHSHQQQTCYNMARKYLELCEREDDGKHLANLNVIQALVFIIRYELRSKQLTRAWMTLGRAITLTKMLNLYQLDNPTAGAGVFRPDAELSLPQIVDPVSLEELRRCLWALYTFECYACIRTNRSCQLHDSEVRVLSKLERKILDSTFAIHTLN